MGCENGLDGPQGCLPPCPTLLGRKRPSSRRPIKEAQTPLAVSSRRWFPMSPVLVDPALKVTLENDEHLRGLLRRVAAVAMPMTAPPSNYH